MKYLLVLIVVFLGFLLLKKQLGAGSRKNVSEQKCTKHEDPHTLRETEPMMRCAQCGVFLPRSAALHIQGRHYCSPEHAKAAESGAVRADSDEPKP